MLASLRSRSTLSSVRAIAGVAVVCFALAACRSQHAASPAAASSRKTDAPVIDTAGSSPDANMASLEAAVSTEGPAAPANRADPAPSDPATIASADDLGSIRYITIQDSQLGMPEGQLAVFPSWHGSVFVNRASGNVNSYNEINLSSADGSESVFQSGVPFALLSPGVSHSQMRNNLLFRNAAEGTFQSAGHVLLQYLLPSLRLGGQPGQVEPANQHLVTMIQNGVAAKGMRGTVVAGAGVRVSGIGGGRDAMVTTISICTGCGTQVESTTTTYTIFKAPTAKLDQLVAAWSGLPAIKVNPAWMQAQQQLAQQWEQQDQSAIQAGAASAAAQRAQTIEAIATSQQAIAAGHARTNAQINQMHQDTQAGINAQNNFDYDQQNRAAQNAGRLSTGVINGQGSAHRWCKGNSSVFVWDRTTSPDGTAGWYQCDNP